MYCGCIEVTKIKKIHNVIWFCAVTIQYSTVVCCSIVYCIILQYTVVCCCVLQCTVVGCSRLTHIFKSVSTQLLNSTIYIFKLSFPKLADQYPELFSHICNTVTFFLRLYFLWVNLKYRWRAFNKLDYLYFGMRGVQGHRRAGSGARLRLCP